MNSNQSILTLINSAPMSESNKRALRRLVPEFLRIGEMPKARKMIIRNKLNAFMHRYKQGSTAELITGGVIYIIKRLGEQPLKDEDVTDGHLITDHAFCAAMRRLGYDVEGFKDKALAEAKEAGLIPVYVAAGSKIVTFLPRIE